MCDKVVVKCASLSYRRAGLEEGFVEKYSQSFGDAERAAGVFHGNKRYRSTQKDGGSRKTWQGCWRAKQRLRRALAKLR